MTLATALYTRTYIIRAWYEARGRKIAVDAICE